MGGPVKETKTSPPKLVARLDKHGWELVLKYGTKREEVVAWFSRDVYEAMGEEICRKLGERYKKYLFQS